MKFSTKKLYIIMARNCINDKVLCESASMPVATFNQVKKGSVIPKPATIGKIAKALNVDVTDLLDE